MNKTLEQWAKVVPDAFLSGSIVQARNVIEMALQDIAELNKEIIKLKSTDELETLYDDSELPTAEDVRGILCNTEHWRQCYGALLQYKIVFEKQRNS